MYVNVKSRSSESRAEPLCAEHWANTRLRKSQHAHPDMGVVGWDHITHLTAGISNVDQNN